MEDRQEMKCFQERGGLMEDKEKLMENLLAKIQEDKEYFHICKGVIEDRQVDFITNFIDQNLEHARHVENERLVLVSMYVAMVAGVMTFSYSIDKNEVALALTGALLFLSLPTMLLTCRWNTVFKNHMKCAEDAYELLQCLLFTGEDLEEDCLSRECRDYLSTCAFFRFHHTDQNEGCGFLRTHCLFIIFEVIIILILLGTFIYFLGR